MKAFALLSLTALLFAANACSDNEAPAGTTGQHAISFNALASKQPRSAATTTASLKASSYMHSPAPSPLWKV